MSLSIRWLKKIWHDPVGSKLIAAGVIAIIGVLVATVMGVWPSIWAAIGSLVSWLRDTSAIYNWFWLIWAIVTLHVTSKIANALFEGRSNGRVSVSDYDREVFFGVRWRWRYAGNKIIDLTSYCANCDYQTFAAQDYRYDLAEGVKYSCEDCGTESDVVKGCSSDVENRVLRHIHKRLRNGTWRDVVDQKLAELDEP